MAVILAATIGMVVAAASFIQAGLGMGFGLTAAPLLALLSPKLVPAACLYLGCATSSWGAWRERGGIVWGQVGIAAMGRAAGVLLSSVILSTIASRDHFDLVFGSMIALAVALSLLGWRPPLNRRSLLGMGFVSGAMGTITSVGAPPLALIYQHQPPAHARPTLAAFFAIGCAMSLVGLHLIGWAGRREFMLALTLVPAMLVGTLIGRRFGMRFDRRYRPLLLAVSGVAGAALMLRGIL